MKELGFIYGLPNNLPRAVGGNFVLIGSTVTLSVAKLIPGTMPNPQPMEIALDTLTPFDEDGAVSQFTGVVLSYSAHREWEEKRCNGWFECQTHSGVIGFSSTTENIESTNPERRVA